MDMKDIRFKLFLLLIIPTLIIASILFIIEFSADAEPPFITLIGFGLLIGSGSFIYFSNMAKFMEGRIMKEALVGYLLFMVPTIIISAVMFAFIDPPTPPYLLVIGLIIFLVGYTGVYFLAVRQINNS